MQNLRDRITAYISSWNRTPGFDNPATALRHYSIKGREDKIQGWISRVAIFSLGLYGANEAVQEHKEIKKLKTNEELLLDLQEMVYKQKEDVDKREKDAEVLAKINKEKYEAEKRKDEAEMARIALEIKLAEMRTQLERAQMWPWQRWFL
jgi:hypothetical protein